MRLQLPTTLVALAVVEGVSAFPNAPPDVPTWCGKPYMSSNHSLDPGGQFKFPAVQASPLLHVTLQPRYSIFLENESASFIVNAQLSYTLGSQYVNKTTDSAGSKDSQPFTKLVTRIYNENDGSLLIFRNVTVNSTTNLFEFPLTSFKPRLQPYTVTLIGTSPDGQQSYTVSSSIYVLPSRNYGSAVKIDNLYGGMYVQNQQNNWKGWYPVFPVGYYADGSKVTPSGFSLAGLDDYANLGFNTINIVPGGATYPAYLGQYWDHMDKINLLNVYDLRNSFQNSSLVEAQVKQYLNRTTLLSWYTGDEPDGWSYPLNSTKLAYDQIKALDPYHPVSLVLNCQNYFYEEYASGGDIIFQDAYPVAVNVTYSVEWNTPCNTTYGDCGCDNCVGELTDVSTRLSTIQSYQANLPGGLSKPTWSVLQAFGNAEYWSAVPTSSEVVAMMLLSLNHAAKGLTYWIYPSSSTVNAGSGGLAKVLKSSAVTDFVFGTNVVEGLEVEGSTLVDASAWVVGGQMMVGIVSGRFGNTRETVAIKLPQRAASVSKSLYGNSTGWSVDGGKLIRSGGMQGLEAYLLVLNLGLG